jgi:phosphonate transport system substrate-binding protein
MNDASSAGSTSGAPRQPHSPGRVLAVVLPIAVVGLAAYWWSKGLEEKARVDAAPTMVARMFAAETMPPTGEMAFADADGDLVADPPSDESKLLKPDTLVFAYVAEEEPLAEDVWKELLAAIQEKTGKEVKLAHFNTAEEQMSALKNGELHIAGLNTGLVQSAVEQSGFVPFCTLGNADGTWGYTMEFIVPAGSPIKKLEDIKGRKVTFSTTDSNSGCKAPLVLLKEKLNFLPERDYQWGFSSGQHESIKGIAERKFEVAPVASDLVAGMKKKGEIDPDSCVSIYTSERYPPATIGYIYNLAPEIREGIKAVLLEFDWTGTGLEREFGPEGKSKFVAISYKTDWANTRHNDKVIAEARKAGAGAPAKSGT